jgi:hypothetical protein
MKQLTFFLAVMLLSVFSLSAQSTSAKATTSTTAGTAVAVNNPNAPEISFEKTVHDYGTIEYKGDGKCEFKFTNTGKEPLILTNVRSSCGCTVPKWPREPILPGQSEIINVEYKTNRIGRINKTITVQSNANTSSVVLRIQGQVLKPEETTPPTNAKSMGQK